MCNLWCGEFQPQYIWLKLPSKLHKCVETQEKKHTQKNKTKSFSCQNLNEDAQIEISTESKKKVRYDIAKERENLFQIKKSELSDRMMDTSTVTKGFNI